MATMIFNLVRFKRWQLFNAEKSKRIQVTLYNSTRYGTAVRKNSNSSSPMASTSLFAKGNIYASSSQCSFSTFFYLIIFPIIIFLLSFWTLPCTILKVNLPFLKILKFFSVVREQRISASTWPIQTMVVANLPLQMSAFATRTSKANYPYSLWSMQQDWSNF